jgi:ribosomal RNA-processing protein 1
MELTVFGVHLFYYVVLWALTLAFSMDKYYMLVRKFVNASFRLLARTKWDAVIVEEYNSILSGPNGPLW